ncbi:N-acetylneuraminate synthase [Proteiniborus sp. DW1]|uniref:N-acetylneuraminate synthase n=1 Tax=Proteiniborus sp. DW1 TaxID=1889883 RepID=UPI00092E075C|nr:N-acetylneuraminate synthase [Proteiniborus sp. DW1]SCG83147.1 N-acetylneuraminate synthase [Proteiniborus sp. DW1]
MSNRVFVIAEIGVNHNGSLELAKKLIDVAAEAGADAVKFQTFITENIMGPFTPKASYQIKNTNPSETQYEMVKKLELGREIHFILKEYCISRHIQILSSPFDLESLDFLADKLNLPIIKIASGEITNAPLLLKAASFNKKIILSTGMSTLGDIEEALGVLAYGYIEGKKGTPSKEAFKEAYYSEIGQRLLATKVTLLHCTTEYPAPIEEINLKALSTLKQCFGLTVGYSDHTLGIAVPLAAVALGAGVIEKHITLDRSLPGPDHKASLEPKELAQMIQGIRQVEKALGNSYKKPSISELKNQKITRKSLVAACDINKGEVFTEKNLTVKRPGGGLTPIELWGLLGKPAAKSYIKDEMIT